MKHKLLSKRLGLGFLSLGLSTMLFMTAQSISYNNSRTQINRLTETYTHTLENVPIDLRYDSDDYFVSGYSYEVEVYLSSTNRIKLDSEINIDTRNFKVVADLSDLSEGTSKVDLIVEDLPSDVTAEIRPETMTVTLGKKVSKTFPVEVELSEEQIASGFRVSGTELALSETEVTSDEATLDLVDRVVAKLPSDTVLSKDYHDSVILQAVTENGTVLPSIISPAKSDVSVYVRKLTKTVPLSVNLVGEVDSSLSSISYELGLSEVIISGSQEALDATDLITITIDVSDIKKDVRKTVTLSADNVTVTPEVVDVKLTANKK